MSQIVSDTVESSSRTDTKSRSCPECDGTIATTDHESVCQRCGLVVDDHHIDRGPDWRPTDDTESKRHTGTARTETLHDRGLTTQIGHGHDANGRSLSGKKRSQLNRLRREHKRGMFESKADRNLAEGFTEVRRILSCLDLSTNLREQACRLFRTAQSEELLVGQSIERVAAACVYAACRCNQTPRTIDEVAEPAKVGADTLQSTYNTLNAELDIPAPPRSPVEFVPQHASALDVPDHVRQTARELATVATETNVAMGCDPSAFAGSCLYQAGRDHSYPISQDAVGDVVGTCAKTIRSHLARLDGLEDDA
ncbi:transcription initiation factor IIB family protein [Halorubellus litoreus]|uniref:Transcription initiation factor IIB family protein n=1 Tax=Halorubellus litoreus TaxID=755308 RepID=A0ABD5VN33_9EURY